MPGPLLTHDEINALVDAALACGLEDLTSRDLLFYGIPRHYVAGLNEQRSPLNQLRFDLEDLSQRPQLEGVDEPPLALWLRNAAERAQPRLEARTFREMRATVLGRNIEPRMQTMTFPDPTSDIPPADAVRIAVLAALPLELAALQEVFGIDRSLPVGARTYEVGWLPSNARGRHGVALALLPDMGNNLAAVAATHLAHDFPNLEHIVLSGIAGGVPRPGVSEHDVRLGDVVISNRNGVVQYDLIKEHHDGTREHRHPPRPPSADLVQVVRKLAAGELRGKRPWEAYLTRGATVGVRPADHLDARGLPGPELPHDSARRAGLPRLFQATIAAANILLKNPTHRDYLGKTFGVKAIEMEGAGVADATWAASLPGYLVVRGICDYCDENKGDAWQPYAAVAAAAVTRTILEGLAGQEETARPQ